MAYRRKCLVVVAVIAALATLSAIPAAAQQAPDILKAGQYTAKVKAIVCGGCVTLIKQTLEKTKNIEAVSVDQAKMTVQFTVRKDGTVKLSDVQKALDAAAKDMGMGADYTLSGLKPSR